MMMRRLFLCALVALVAWGTATTAAGADVIHGEKHFSGSDRAFSATDRNGTFNAQTYYQNEPPPEIGQFAGVAWSFQIAPQVQAIAISPMDCTAGIIPDARAPYHDFHPGLPVDYLWHSSTPTVNFAPASYQLWGNCTFRVSVGGNTGTANLGLTFHFDIADGLPTTVPDGEAYASQLNVTYDAA
jgi:hypothetical protein